MPPFPSITKPTVGDPTEVDFADDVVDALDNLNGRTAGSGQVDGLISILNGSFEVDADLDEIPDNWYVNTFPGGSFSMDTSAGNFNHGATAIKFVAPGGTGNGGGTIDTHNAANGTADLFPIAPNFPFSVRFWTKSSVANLINKVEVFWWKADGSASSTASSIVWSDSSTNPTSWKLRGGTVTSPSDAYFCSVRLTGGDQNSPAGTARYDGVEFFKPKWHGEQVFYNTPGTYTFNPKDDSESVIIEAVGAGGGGGGPFSATGAAGGGGGGGAGNILQINIHPGDVLTVIVGSNGSGGGFGVNGTDGGDTIIQLNGTTVYTMGGGKGGQAGGSAGTGGNGGNAGSAVAYDQAHVIFSHNGLAGGNHSGGGLNSTPGGGGANGGSGLPSQVGTGGTGGNGGAPNSAGTNGQYGFVLIHY